MLIQFLFKSLLKIDDDSLFFDECKEDCEEPEEDKDEPLPLLLLPPPPAAAAAVVAVVAVVVAETAAATDAAEEIVTEGAERAITVASKALGRSFSLGVVTRMCLANLITSTTSSGG